MGLCLALVAVLSLGVGYAHAKAYLSQDQALRAAFGTLELERKTLFLSPAQVARIESLARARLGSPIVSYYISEGKSGARELAFFDRRLVRTMPVSFMTVVDAKGALSRVEILAFEEPEDYLPRPRWLELFKGRVLDDKLALGRSIPKVTGASLTSQSLTEGVRTALAVYEVAVK